MSKGNKVAQASPKMDIMEQIAFLNSVLDGSTEFSIIAKDLNGTILSWNEGARRIYGYEPNDIIGKRGFILHEFKAIESGGPLAILDVVCKEGKWFGELTGVRKNGVRFLAYVTITLRKDEIDKPIGYTMISQDLTEYQKILRELKESQEYNRGLIESNIDALITTDQVGIISDVNCQMCEMTGYSREEIIGTPFKNYFTNPQQAEDGIRKVLAEDRVTNYELTMRSLKGKEIVVSYNATTFRDVESRLKGVFAAARDITAQKHLEDDLWQAQNYTRSLIEASVDALLTVDPDLKITDVNEQTVHTTGYSREELIGSNFPDYFTDPDKARAGVEKTLLDGFLTDYVLSLRSCDGRETLVSFNASVFKDTQGNIRGIFAAARNITEQKRLEEELRQAQNYTRGLIESSVDPMITVDQDLIITDVNEQMVKLTEVPKNKLIGSRFDNYFTEPKRAASGVRQTLNQGYVTNYELTLRTTPRSREVLVSFNASIFRDPEGTIRGVFAVARDVTEQKRLEQQLREQQNYSRGLIEASVDALVMVDPKGHITDVNEQMICLIGESRKKLIGTPFASYFTDPERASVGLRTTYEKGIVKNYELNLRSNSDTGTFVSFNAAVFNDTEGKVAGIFAAARDVTAQKELEAELREQQAYNRGLIESNIDALMTTNLLGIITDVNIQMCTITGYSREELIGTPFKNYFTNPHQAEEGICKVLAEGRVTNYELTIRAKDSKETFVSYNATTYTWEDGRLRGIFAAARDITAQKNLEDQLRQAQNYNRGLIESSIDAMLTVDPDLTITDVNEQMVRLTGFQRDELIGSDFKEYFTDPEQAKAGVKKTLDKGYVTNYELLLRSRYRREILVSFNASVFKDTEGKLLGIFAVARDVTEQRRLEERLRESQNYNRGLIESSVDALVTVDPELTITDVNEQMVKLTGYSREELIGSAFKDYFTEPNHAVMGVRQTFDQSSVTNYELVLKSRTGKRTVVSFNAGTFKDTSGHVAGILAAARDISAQKKLEEELREQQNYNRRLIESSVDALMIVDPNGVITDVNEQTVKLIGYNRRQLIGSPFIDYFTEPDLAQKGVHKTFHEGSVTNYELIIRLKSGRKVPVSFNAAVFSDTSGEVSGILAAARDITQQKQIEQALREQQNYTRGLIESNIDALITIDTIGIITDVNKQMCAISGRAREELIGTVFKNYFTKPQQAEDGIRKVLSEERVINYELTLLAKNGKEIVVSYNATIFRGTNGSLRGVFASVRDISDQKYLERQIREQNRELTETTNFLNNILESSTEYSIVAIDLDRTILAWNAGAQRNYGYTVDEMVNKQKINILFTKEDIETGQVDAFFNTALKTGKAEGIFERVRKNGECFTASATLSLRKTTNGTTIGYVLISKDITDQKRLEEQLRTKNIELEEKNRRVQEANRLKSEFLANMSHELRTPLNGIIGFTELIHDGKVGSVSKEQKEYLGDILSSSKHLLQLINDVLDLSKVESGKMEFHPEKVKLEKVIREVIDILRTFISKKQIHLETKVSPKLKQIFIDPSKLKQVLYNYISNSLKFTPDGGKISIHAIPEANNSFRIEVQDNGIGIHTEDLKHLFVEFQQLDASIAKKYQGTGLGLALTKRIVEAQGGEVGVKSTFGKGSIFYAIFPWVTQKKISSGLVSKKIKILKTEASLNQPTILVIEDDAKDREFIVETLNKAGYQTEIAINGKEAIQFGQTKTYDAITLDLLLPDMNGWDVLNKLRKQGPNQETPIIVVSVVLEKLASVGFRVHDFLVKPANKKTLLRALNQVKVAPDMSKSALVVDNNAYDLKFARTLLQQLGYQVICEQEPENALKLVKKNHFCVIVLDLLMPKMNGFEFLYFLRQTKQGQKIPVIVWTAKDLMSSERDQLQALAQSVILKSGESTKYLLMELKRYLPTTGIHNHGE
ncbi:TPA: PAS domain S-box protein [Legionella pneumophila]|nr:PAS domain S-box protein [Legionella pneumophila]HAT8181057.1 PAS domain S-box protein [Legionella pneumophila]